jgi:hypothetical protein
VIGKRVLSEAAFTDAVIELARLGGWRVAHFRPARTASGWRTPVQGDGAGFPDKGVGEAGATPTLLDRHYP